MEDRIVEEREMSIGEYLGMFDPESVDFALIKERSAKIARIVVKKVQSPSGQIFEDTTFTEKNGVTYTVRSIPE
jgi:hypothetical protein